MSCKSRIVKWQKVREVKTGKSFSGEQSAYWNWANKHSKTNESGILLESREANPDCVADEEEVIEKDTINRRAMRLAIKTAKLSLRQRAVIEMLGIRGHSEEKTAKLLGINRSTVRVLFRRAQKKLEAAYVTILANGVDTYEDTLEDL